MLLAEERVAGCIGTLDRGDGVVKGERLFRYMITWARERGFERLMGWSDKRFEEAHGLYAKVGMEWVGERICDDSDESPEWGIALSLRG